MRVSTSQIFSAGTFGMQSLQSDLYKTQNQLSTGKRILTPEDDPVGAAQALMVTQSQAVNKQFIDNQSTATSQLNFVDSTLSGANDTLQNIYQDAVQGGNASLDPTQKGMIAADLKQRLTSLIALANTQDGTGQYVFAGFKSNVQPFQVNAAATGPYSLATGTSVSYNGDSGNVTLQVTASQTMSTSENGMDVFMQTRDAQGNVTGRSIFDGVKNMIDQLDPNSGVPFSQASYTQALSDISNSISHIATARASVGARIQSVNSMTTTGQDIDTQLAARLSSLQDLDYTAAISHLSQTQMQYQAAQLSFKQTSQLSLFNVI